ncbi:MAG: hypothetical protein WC812_04685 [Candidatus Pacearchaeota archaeon]
MTGFTAGIAAAASFPAPFVQSGVADVAIVYGTGTGVSSVDFTHAGNIQTTLGESMPSTGGTPVGGESYKFEKTSTKFHLGDNFTTLRETLTDDHLPVLLGDGIYVDDDNDEFDYTQKIEMNASVLSMFSDSDYDDSAPTVGFRIASGYNVLNYTVTFVDQPLMSDLVTSTLPIMGKEYYVLSNSTSGANNILTLLDSADSAIVSDAEGDSITLTAGGKTYVVTVPYISSTEVKLSINGETTNTLNEAETQKLSDGSYVGIRDIMYNAHDTGVSQVEFSIGSGKLKITSGSEIQINDNIINGITAVITNSSAAATTLTSIELEWKTDDDTFITEGSEITMPGFGIVKLSYTGLTFPTEEEFTVEQGSDTYIMLNDFPVKDGTIDIPLLYGSAGGPYSGLGKDATNKLVTSNITGSSVPLKFDKDTDEMFVVTYETTTECESYVLKATSFGVDTANNNQTTIQRWKDGAWTDERDVKATDTFSIGSAELGVQYVERSPGNFVNITSNSSSTKFNILCSDKGLKLWLPWTYTAGSINMSYKTGAINLTAMGDASENYSAGFNGTNWYLQMQEEDKDGNIAAGDQWNISLGWDSSTTAEPQVSDLRGEDVTAVKLDSDSTDYRSFMYSALATEFIWHQPSSDQDSIDILYHGDEVAADVYITSPEATTTGTSSLGNVLVKDSEVASVQSKNLIVVGGSCINSVAANLVGGSYCGPSFTTATGVGAGQFLIQSYGDAYTTGKVALLVAGYNVDDTANGATYLRTKTVDTTAGKKYIGTSSTEATLQVA